MEWLSKIFSRPGRTKRDYPNITRGKDPLEVWNKTGELGDGAFGKVYKVGTVHRPFLWLKLVVHAWVYKLFTLTFK